MAFGSSVISWSRVVASKATAAVTLAAAALTTPTCTNTGSRSVSAIACRAASDAGGDDGVTTRQGWGGERKGRGRGKRTRVGSAVRRLSV